MAEKDELIYLDKERNEELDKLFGDLKKMTEEYERKRKQISNEQFKEWLKGVTEGRE